MCSTDCFLVLLAILFPPLPVWVKRGICSGDSVINIALCILGLLPGLLHAWYIIAKYPDPFDNDGAAYRRYNIDAEVGGHQRYTCGRRERRERRQPSHGGMVYTVVRPQQQGYGTMPSAGPAEGPSNGEPPSYADVVKGDNKVQHD